MHDCKRKYVQDEDYKADVQVIKPGGKYDPIQSPECGSNADGDSPKNYFSPVSHESEILGGKGSDLEKDDIPDAIIF
jgi:hypothetical protein